MSARTWDRYAAASGFAVVACGAAATAFERTPATAADYAADRPALLAQSMLFLAGSGFSMWFAGSLYAHLRRYEGSTARLSAVAFGAAYVWIALNVLAQAFQVGATRGGAPDALIGTMHAVFTTANLPLAVMLAAVAVVSLRHGAFPGWLGWLAVVAAAAHLVLWAATVVDSGPLGPTGWLSFALYPLFLVWLVPATVVMMRRAAPPTAAAAR